MRVNLLVLISKEYKNLKENIVSLRNPENLKIMDGLGNIYFGCDQEWFGSKWKRLAGCGPCAASNILLYLHRCKNVDIRMNLEDKADSIVLIETVWRHVTPTLKGVYLLKQFCKGVHSFLKSKGVELGSFSLEIPKKRTERPDLSRMLDFISQGLLADTPVAFLNLSNGLVTNLDSWHWVTIVSLKISEQENVVSAHVYDGARYFDVDLKLWYETTTAGGGFVYFKASA